MGITIGVLGYGGTVGRFTTEYLLKQKFHVIGGQRHQSTFFKNEKNFSSLCMNLENKTALQEFCHACDVVVNCTSPSSLYGAIIAEAAAEQKKLYIDPSNLAGFHTECYPDSKFILSCGYMPGLSEYLVSYLADNYFDKTEEVSVYQGGTEFCSPSAFADIILSAELSGHGDACLLNGEIKPLKTNICNSYSLPFFDHDVIMKPFLSNDMLSACREYGAEKVCSFNIYPDTDILDIYFRAIFAAVEAGTDRKKATEKIMDIVRRYQKPNSCFGTLAVEMSGIQNGMHKIMRTVVNTSDSAKICGFFLAECIASATSGKADFKGTVQGFRLLDKTFWNKIATTLTDTSFSIEEIKNMSFQL